MDYTTILCGLRDVRLSAVRAAFSVGVLASKSHYIETCDLMQATCDLQRASISALNLRNALLFDADHVCQGGLRHHFGMVIAPHA